MGSIYHTYQNYFYQTFIKDIGLSKIKLLPDQLLRRSIHGKPLPPPFLRWLVIHKTDPQLFFESGRIQVEDLIIPLLNRNGYPVETLERILDFGCGCGRLLTHFPNTKMSELHGCDYNKLLIHWCQKKLKHIQFFVNSPLPPLPKDSNYFDFIFARSVFTHFTEHYQNQWLKEIYRILKPGGIFIITIKGEHAFDWLSPNEKLKFKNNELVVRHEIRVGENICATFHPIPYITDVLQDNGFEILERLPAHTHLYMRQDAILVKKVG